MRGNWAQNWSLQPTADLGRGGKGAADVGPDRSRADNRQAGPARDPLTAAAAVDLYWLPLGAGGRSVKYNGRAYEALMARRQRRRAFDIYHSALQVHVGQENYVVEQAPVPDLSGELRGVVAEGPVGSRRAGMFRIFRYEIRVWQGGCIPDVSEAVDSPVRLSEDEACARRVLASVPRIPTPVWGRDELATGEMWNSNAVIAWVIVSCGIDVKAIRPPVGGRAPGWGAGVVVANRTRQTGGDGLRSAMPYR